MKKMLLSAAAFAVVAVSAVAVAPTTSEAVPAFARQTGAACLSCHFQSFPTLSAFGRSFKQGALTDVGEQALIEDEELSIPASLNATVVVRPNVVFKSTAAGVKTKDIVYKDQVVLIGGRVGENVGTFLEVSFGLGGGFGNHQIFTSWDLGGFKAGLNYYNTGFGEDAGMQLMSVWGQHGGLMGGKGISINHRMSKSANAPHFGFALWGGNDMVTVQLGEIAAGGIQGAAGLPSLKLATMLRGVGFFDVGGAEMGVGAIVMTGDIYDPATLLNPTPTLLSAKRWGLDFQVQGEFGDTQVGFYADYAQASKSTLAKTNVYNTSTVDTRKGYSARVTVKPVHNMVFMLGYGQDKTGAVSIKSTLLGAEYELYQNFVIALTYQADKVTAGTNKTTTLDIEMLM